MSISSLHTLPTELLYRIIDYIDTETIFLSFRNVSKRFYTIVNTYDQHQLDFCSMKKKYFHKILKFIDPKNIKSLILSDGNKTSGQIELFLTHININNFSHLNSLTLIQIKESNLITILTHIHINSLISLSINIQNEYLSNINDTTMNYISLIINKLNNLQYFYFKLQDLIIFNLPISKQCSIKHLILHKCSHQQCIIILNYLPHLRILELRNHHIFNIDESLDQLNHIQTSLETLFIECVIIQTDNIQSFLFSIPSLIHFEIIASINMSDSLFNGFQWEEFIEKKLPNLQKFDFFFKTELIRQQTPPNIQSILTSYQTSFWLEKNHWYISCEYFKKLRLLYIFSLPICTSDYTYDFEYDKIFRSTLPTIKTDITSIMNNISHLHIHLRPIMTNKYLPKNDYLFSNVTILTFLIDDKYSKTSIDYLSTHINFLFIKHISINLKFNQNSFLYVKNSIHDLLHQAIHVQSLNIHYQSTNYLYEPNIKIICSVILKQIKHLKININNINDMKIILDQLRHLTSVIFKPIRSRSIQYEELIEWLRKKKRNFTYRTHMEYLGIWLGEDNHTNYLTSKISTKS